MQVLKKKYLSKDNKNINNLKLNQHKANYTTKIILSKKSLINSNSLFYINIIFLLLALRWLLYRLLTVPKATCPIISPSNILHLFWEFYNK